MTERNRSRREAASWRGLIVEKCCGRCYVCDFYCPTILVIHHKRPVHANGEGTLDNLVGLCPNCHAVVHAAGSRRWNQRGSRREWLLSYLSAEQAQKMEELIAVLLNPMEVNP